MKQEKAKHYDEKIRKEIISYIKSSGAVTNQEWIAWLEKQSSEQNHWRPSSNQIEAMDTLMVNLNRNPLLLDNFTQANLRLLYEDLNKLAR